MPLLSEPLTETILAAVFEVRTVLGSGFLEAVYRRALLHELTARGAPRAHSGSPCQSPSCLFRNLPKIRHVTAFRTREPPKSRR